MQCVVIFIFSPLFPKITIHCLIQSSAYLWCTETSTFSNSNRFTVAIAQQCLWPQVKLPICPWCCRQNRRCNARLLPSIILRTLLCLLALLLVIHKQPYYVHFTASSYNLWGSEVCMYEHEASSRRNPLHLRANTNRESVICPWQSQLSVWLDPN